MNKSPMTIGPSPSNKIVLAPVEPSLFPVDFPETDIPATILAVTNLHTKDITCLVMKWVAHHPGLANRIRWMKIDGYGFPPVRSVLRRQERLIVSPFGSQDEETFKGQNSFLKMDSPLRAHFGEPELEGSITVSADLVVFDDG